MNQMMLLLCLPALSALASILVVYSKPTPALQARRWLILSMVCGALCALLLAHYYHPVLRLSLTLDILFHAVMLCLAPCFYLCLLSLTSLDGIQRRNYLIFAPGTILLLIIMLLEVIMGPAEAQAALEEIILRTRPVSPGHSWAFRAYAFFGHQFNRSFIIIGLMAVFYWGAWAIHDYRKRLEDYLVDIPLSLTRGIGLLYVSFILFATVGMVFAACEYAQTFTTWIMPTLSIGIAISFVMMGYFALQVEYSAEMIASHSLSHTYPFTPPTTPLTPPISATTPLTPPTTTIPFTPPTTTIPFTGREATVIEDPFLERLAIIEREQLYRDPNLTIFSLSRTIGTNRTYLTKAFRECYGETFSAHINRLRIEEAIRLLTESPQMTLNEVAARVGYNSATSLYRNFIRLHHCSPTEYMKRN